MASDLSVRQLMRNAGYDNNKIGYDTKTGWVTYDNKPFMKPSKIYQGTSFTDQASFDKANQAFRSRYNPSPITTMPISSTYQNTSPYNLVPASLTNQQQNLPDYRNLISDLYNRLNTTSNFDPYSTPQYKAYQEQAQRAAQEGVRAAQEALGASGFARSTNLSDRAQRIQNQANEYLTTQVVPQIIAQEEARRQQQLQNLSSLIGTLMNVDREQFNRGVTTAQLYGRGTLPPEAQNLVNQALYNKQAWWSASPEERQRLAAENQHIYRTLSTQYGVDPTLINERVDYQTALRNAANLAPQTLQARQFEESIRKADRDFAYRQLRDQIADKQWQKQFDEDTRRFGLEYALNRQIQLGNLSARQAELALSRQRLNADLQQQALDNQFREKEFALRQQQATPYNELALKAAQLAQSDSNWFGADDQTKQEIFNYYLNLLSSGNQSTGGVTDEEILQYLR